MELVTVKLIVLSLSGLVRIIFGMIPLVVMKLLARSWSKGTDKRMKKVISILMFFGGGVLLATCFLHMMPEVRDSFREAEPDLELPLSEIIFLAGFFLVYLIEDIVHSIIHQRRSRKQQAKLNSIINLTTTNTAAAASMQKTMLNQSNINANQSLSCRNNNKGMGMTLFEAEDKRGLHNNDGDITVSTIAAVNGVNIATKCNGVVPTPTSATNSHTLSLSSSQAEHAVVVTPKNHLRGTKDIFRKNSKSNADEIPGLSRSQNGIGGITNGAFVSEKFQYCDPDWMRDIANNTNSTNAAILLPRGRRSICNELILGNVANTNNTGVRSDEEKEIEDYNSHPNHSQHSHSHNHFQQRSSSSENNNNVRQNNHKYAQTTRNQNHSHMPLNSESDTDISGIGAEIRNILIVIAISFHGIFEGMAIGLQGTAGDVWYLFLAVSLHECTILFCIGVELISSKTKVFRMILYVLVVSLVSPAGIAIGIIISERSYGEVIHQALIVGCFQGLAAGTLLYVTFFEIFQEEGKKLHRKCYHILIAVLGFVLMGSLEFMGGHNHGESKQEHGSGNCSHKQNDGAENNHDHDHAH